jgi:DNA-binding IclR family transcriptional regulator
VRTREAGLGGDGGDARVKSADRVMAVLDLVGETGSLSFAEIVSRLELPKSSAHALLRTIQQRRYLVFDEDRRVYRLGTRIWELARSHNGVEDLRDLMKPLMDALVDQTQETVQLATLDGLEAVYIELSESPHPMKLTSRSGVRLPAHASAIGKALLADLSPDEAAQRLGERELVALTAHTVSDVPSLLTELERIRRQGYSVDNEEFAVGLRCIAMPVRDINGTPVAAMSVSLPTPRYSREVAAQARAALGETVGRAAHRLGSWER